MSRYNNSLLWAGKQFVNRLCQDVSYRYDAGFCHPSRIILCMTTRCNLKCPQCGFWRMKDVPRELDTQEWKNVLTKLRKWLGPHRIQMAGGEVFIRKDMVEIVGFAAQQDILPGIVSNGTFFTPEIAQGLVDAGLGYLDISLDGTKAETHDYLRGRKGVFEDVMNSVRYFKDAMAKNPESKMSLTIASVISGRNIDEVLGVLKFVEQEKLTGVIYNPIGPACDADKEWYKTSDLWPAQEDLPRLIAVVEELIERKRNGAPILNSDDQLLQMKTYFQNPAGCSDRSRDCHAGQTNFLISSEGNIHCCFHMTPIGTHNDDFATVWRSAKARETRKQIKRCPFECSPGNLLYRRSLWKEIQRYLTYR